MRGQGADGLLIADDGAIVRGALQRIRQQGFEHPAARIVLAALEFRDDDVLFGFQLLRIERGVEGHVADYVHAELPVAVGHVGDVYRIVIARGRVQIAARGFHFLADGAFGAAVRALEHHMFEHVADARLIRRFIRGTGVHVEAGGDEGEAGILQDEHGQTVGQFSDLLLFPGKRIGDDRDDIGSPG